MKILTTYQAKNAFPKVLKLSQKDVVIVTNRGKPVAAIQGLKGLGGHLKTGHTWTGQNRP